MNIIATHINYYTICHRKLWLFANAIQMEHTLDTVYDGKLLHDSSYPQRAKKHGEMELTSTKNGITLSGKVDFYDYKQKVIHETKRGKTIEQAHALQVKFYIWLFELNGIHGVTGRIEYPKLRKTSDIALSRADVVFLEETINGINNLLHQKKCPSTINSKICKKCSYYQLCYIDEV